MASYIRGDRQTVRNLRSLAKGLPAASINRSARVAMKPMLTKAKQNANRHRNYVGKWPKQFTQPKAGRQSVAAGLKFRIMKPTKRMVRHYWIGATGRAIKLAHLLEFGTAPHKQPKFLGGWYHPGARPRPFMTPAYESEKNNVERSLGHALWGEMQRRIVSLSGR